MYALRAGKVVWSRHLGTPVRRSTLPCGNIDPLGITGTPVYDGSSGVLYVAAELAGPLRHTLYALNAVNGKVLWRKGLTCPAWSATSSSSAARSPSPTAGSTCRWAGWPATAASTTATSSATARAGRPVGLQDQGHRGRHLGAVRAERHPRRQHPRVGRQQRPHQRRQGYDHSDSILRAQPDPQAARLLLPTSWAEDNARDLDLSSMGPAYIPGGKVFIAGKRGVAYLAGAEPPRPRRRPAQLLGCRGVPAAAAPTQSVVFAPCRGRCSHAIKISGNHMTRLWKAPSNITGSPIYGGGAVSSLDPGQGVLSRPGPDDRQGPAQRRTSARPAGSPRWRWCTATCTCRPCPGSSP